MKSKGQNITVTAPGKPALERSEQDVARMFKQNMDAAEAYMLLLTLNQSGTITIVRHGLPITFTKH